MHGRDEVRELTHRKLTEIEEYLATLDTLLVNLCQGSESGCPIIDNLDNPAS